MSDDWSNGYKVGYIAGYEAAMAHKDTTEKSVVSIKDPGVTTPDGLSYEEIYGSIIYQQNKKKKE